MAENSGKDQIIHPEVGYAERSDYWLGFVQENLSSPHLLANKFAELEASAAKDPLTGLFNIGTYNLDIIREMALAERMGSPLVLAVMDLDGFKELNARIGHGEANEVLKSVSSKILAIIRATDRAYRWGGDEFALLLPNTTAEEALEPCERIREAVANDLESRGVTFSIGLGEMKQGQKTPETLFGAADRALYEAKNTGKNKVVSPK